MRTFFFRIALLSLVACGGSPQAPPPPPPQPSSAPSPPPPIPTAAPKADEPPADAEIEARSCVGKVEAAEGLKEVQDRALLEQALGEPGKGKLCTAKVFEVVRPVTVYRVWNQARHETAMGRWWSFHLPKGPVAAYRAANAVCPEWSELTIMIECKLKVGARVVVGPGQSADCARGVSYPQSATNQVFMLNDTRKEQVQVEACSSGAVWP